jgi:hypothetical protein
MPQRPFIDPPELTATTARQAGLVTYAQAAKLGVPASTIRYRCRLYGPWQQILPGVYLTVRQPPTWQQLMRAALLYAGEAAVVTGAEALRLHSVTTQLPEGEVQLLIPARQRLQERKFVRVTRTIRMPEAIHIGQFPVAPLVRATVDACLESLDIDQVRAVATELVRDQRVSVMDLGAELAASQRRGSARLRLALREVHHGVRSAAEAWFYELVVSSGLPMPSFNADIRAPGGELVAVGDAVWEAAAVIVEVDSREHHLSPAAWESTMRRHAALTALGYLVIHVSPHQIKTEPARIVAQIRQALLLRPA